MMQKLPTALFFLIQLSMVLFCSPAFSESPKSFDELIAAYKTAQQSKSLPGLEELVFWEGVEPADRARVKSSFEEDIQREIEKVEIADLPANQILEYKMHGATYRPNLKPVKKLLVSYKKGTGQVEVTGSGYLVGQHGSEVLITPAAPVK